QDVLQKSRLSFHDPAREPSVEEDLGSRLIRGHGEAAVRRALAARQLRPQTEEDLVNPERLRLALVRNEEGKHEIAFAGDAERPLLQAPRVDGLAVLVEAGQLLDLQLDIEIELSRRLRGGGRGDVEHDVGDPDGPPEVGRSLRPGTAAAMARGPDRLPPL